MRKLANNTSAKKSAKTQAVSKSNLRNRKIALYDITPATVRKK